MRKPKIENKYNLLPTDIEKFHVLDKKKLKKKCWRNNVVKGWVFSREISDKQAKMYCAYNDVCVVFYDKNSPEKKDKDIEMTCSCWGGMGNYNFHTFYNPKEIENDMDLRTQECLLQFMNSLLDEQICSFESQGE